MNVVQKDCLKSASIVNLYLMILILILAIWSVEGQQENQPPRFLAGGDMGQFSIRENTPVGKSVYTLRGIDPEGTDVTFSISGDHFSVDRNTGVVTLVKTVDREVMSSIEAIITITDGRIFGIEPKTIPIRLNIPVKDVNDNKPVFKGEPYFFTVLESAIPGSTLFSNIAITDEDDGVNSQIRLSCVTEETPEACGIFDVRAARTGNGKYIGIISLRAVLDYEKRTKYTIKLRAQDGGGLSTESKIEVAIKDIQDRPPILLNAPYSKSVPEGTKSNEIIFKIVARDGDLGEPFPVSLSIEGDDWSYFALHDVTYNSNGEVTAYVITTEVPIDREHPSIVQNGGIYSFYIRAEEDGGQREFSRSKAFIVVTDIDDEEPKFNNNDNHLVNVSESIIDGTPLPGLDVVVTDDDTGENARFMLHLEDVTNSNGIFSVFPKSAVGRAPVIVKVVNGSALDYENPNANSFAFKIIVSRNGIPAASTLVNVSVTDANDNAPVFKFSSYRFSVAEGTKPGHFISYLRANDSDSGNFGNVSYSMKGFGAEKFRVNATTGELSVAPCGVHFTCVDYERQTLFSLTYSATDGGGLLTSVNIFIEVIDQNDNSPIFETVEYRRTVDEKADIFEPPLVVKATDADGKEQGDGRVTFAIQTGNTKDEAFGINNVTGEIMINRPLTHMDTASSIYTLTVRATDGGMPPRYNDIRIIITVGRDKNRPPRFTKSVYHAEIPETAKSGTEVVVVKARDPDGNDESVKYRMGFGAGDHFHLDEKSGRLTIATTADLNRDIDSSYLVNVIAIDGGKETQQTSTAEVNITLTDINNQQPAFDKQSYMAFVNERANIGQVVVTTKASDPDVSAKLMYEMTQPIFAYDKTGVVLKKNSSYRFQKAFGVNESTGEVYVAGRLDHKEASVVVLTVGVTDTAADPNYLQQNDTTEVTIYIQVFNDKNPIFPSPWTPSNPFIMIDLDEEEPIGVDLFSVSAKDPVTGRNVRRYEKVLESDIENIFNMDPLNGKVKLNSKLDFETSQTQISFEVLAVAGDRTSQATIKVNLKDINDNNPQFSENEYHTRIRENSMWPTIVLKVTATDKDTADNGMVKYSLSGEDKLLFIINETTGQIQVARGARLDREITPVVTLEVTAFDMPSGGAARRKTSVPVKIELMDVNDEMPKWTEEKYTAVIAENTNVGAYVVQMVAKDPDLGVNGIVRYRIPELQGTIDGLFDANPETGIITVKESLGGKGRNEPYELKVRAIDGGSPQQFSEATLVMFIGDVSINDGVPVFISPKTNEVASVMENSQDGTAVFQVEAIDADSSDSPNGKLVYSFLEGSTSDIPLYIDASTGLITTRGKLDREVQDQYSVVIVAQDLGRPAQVTSRVLVVNVTDVDDNDPVFTKLPGKEGMELEVEEEAATNTIIGYVEALDRDIGNNAMINYKIIDGNDEGLIGINRTVDNKGMIYVRGRIDREKISRIILTVACGMLGQRMKTVGSYDVADPSLLRVTIRVQDLDDNRPEFKQAVFTTGIRIDAPLQTEILRLHAVDRDPTSLPIKYFLYNASLLHIKDKEQLSVEEPVNGTDVFILEKESGILRTRTYLKQFSGDVFTVYVSAESNLKEKPALAKLTLYVLRDADLLRFVFDKTPKEVRTVLSTFKKEVEKALPVNDPLNLYDAIYYSDSRGKINYEKTGSCFQLIGRNIAETKKLLDTNRNKRLKNTFNKFSVIDIEPCLPKRVSRGSVDWIEIWVLVIAAFIGIGVSVASCAICCLYSKYKQRLRRTANQMRLLESPHLAPSVIPGSIIMLPSNGPTPPLLHDQSQQGPPSVLHQGPPTMLHQMPPTMLHQEHPGVTRKMEWQDRPFDTVSYGSINR